MFEVWARKKKRQKWNEKLAPILFWPLCFRFEGEEEDDDDEENSIIRFESFISNQPSTLILSRPVWIKIIMKKMKLNTSMLFIIKFFLHAINNELSPTISLSTISESVFNIQERNEPHQLNSNDLTVLLWEPILHAFN